ncbi:hypothetical protein FRC07_009351 [Ceratobasidium sp. 392]|nr:hypothetical protein FRC07_009351 [Ceratobasidium sp. 392]
MSAHSRPRKRPREVDTASNNFRACCHCGVLYSLYKNAWKHHEKRCPRGPSAEPAPQMSQPSVPLPVDFETPLNSPSESSSDDNNPQGPPEASVDWANFGGLFTHDSQLADPGSEDADGGTAQPDTPIEDASTVPSLHEGDLWIKRHPASGRPSGLSTSEAVLKNKSSRRLPPWFPFRTLDDFIQAKIFSDFGATDGHINRQLAHSSRSTLKNAKEYHDTLAIAARLEGEFVSEPVVTEWEGRSFTHYAHFQPVFPVLTQLVGDPDFAKDMVYYPEEPYVHRPGTPDGAMQMWEELWHGRLWWKLQDCVGADKCIMYLVIYIDETNVSKIGGVKVWPIYLWVGNLPAFIRKRRGEKGGGTLIGYLPKAWKDSGVNDLAGFRCQVYHDSLQVIFEALKIPAKYGAPMRCGDGVTRNFVPIIAAGAADYMEFIRMVCILGHKSKLPCPICLVPRRDQSQLMKQWPMRTVPSTEDVLRRANNAVSAAQRDSILKEQSLRNIRSAFFDIIPPCHSIYNAMIADPLHQIEQGIWGKHLWVWIKDALPKASKQILDDRIKSIQRYPDLKHFPNGITELEYITGKEHGIILRLIVPLIGDLLNHEYRKLILSTFRSLAVIHMLAKFTTHTDITLKELDNEIERFDRLHRKLADIFEELRPNYPKYHSLSHLTYIIRQHSTTDNYHTGLGEALHPQSKKDYRRTNCQPDFEIQMLRMYQEREAIMRICARVDAAAKHDEQGEENSESDWDGPRVHFGSRDRQGKQLATALVQKQVQRNPNAQHMARILRTFLYQTIGGFGNRIHFRESDLPSLEGMTVSTYHLASIGYSSILDSRNGLDLARSTESWRNQGPRHDFIIANDGKEFFVARLLNLFKLKARDKQHSIAYVRMFRVDRRSKSTGCIELTDTGNQKFILIDTIIRSCVVVSPGIRESKHVLWDLEGPDMYLRLREL